MREPDHHVHLYLTACNAGFRTYVANSQGDTVYHRQQTIAASRWFGRHSSFSDYQFSGSTAPAVPLVDTREVPA